MFQIIILDGSTSGYVSKNILNYYRPNLGQHYKKKVTFVCQSPLNPSMVNRLWLQIFLLELTLVNAPLKMVVCLYLGHFDNIDLEQNCSFVHLPFQIVSLALFCLFLFSGR